MKIPGHGPMEIIFFLFLFVAVVFYGVPISDWAGERWKKMLHGDE